MFYKYYAECDFGGCGSFGNGSTQKEAINNCIDYLQDDWGMKEGNKISVALYQRNKNKDGSASKAVFKKWVNTTV